MKSSFNFRFAVFATVLFTGIHTDMDFTDLPQIFCQEQFCELRSSYEFQGKSCECDAKCVTYNDCCFDSEYLEQNGLNSGKSICMPGKKNYNLGVYAISTCQPNWQGSDEIKNKCEVGNDLSDPLMSTPATDKRQNVTYRSRYCAECNNADPDELTYWVTSIRCHNPSAGFVRDFFDDMIYIADLNEWGYIRNKTYYTCYIWFAEPNFIESHVRDCRLNLIETCPSTWRNRRVKILCESFMAMVKYKRNFYRNRNCALCNGINMDEVECSVIKRGDTGTPALSILFDANQSDGDTVGKIIRKNPPCPDGQNYDPFFKKCRELSCGLPGFKMEDGNCVNT